jgi:hypothetical protein
MLMDPDQWLWRPLTHDFGNTAAGTVLFANGTRLHTRVAHGQPMAQKYTYLDALPHRLLDAQYRNAMFANDTVAAEASPLSSLTYEMVMTHYIAGPPYFATGRE